MGGRVVTGGETFRGDDVALALAVRFFLASTDGWVPASDEARAVELSGEPVVVPPARIAMLADAREFAAKTMRAGL